MRVEKQMNIKIEFNFKSLKNTSKEIFLEYFIEVFYNYGFPFLSGAMTFATGNPVFLLLLMIPLIFNLIID
jgi:hypothetical protein